MSIDGSPKFELVIVESTPLKDAKKVFQSQGRTKEVDFADNLIAQITTRKTRHS